MFKLIVGNVEVKGKLYGVTPGSSLMEIDFGGGVKLTLEPGERISEEKFGVIGRSMTTVGLSKLQNSTVDMNTGKISMVGGDGKVKLPKKLPDVDG